MIAACDARHAALQAAHAALPMIGPALIADAGAWVSHHTGGGNFAWALETFDGGARILIVDDDGGLGDERSESFSVFLDNGGDTSDWSADAATMPEAVKLAGMIHAARAFATGFREPVWDDAYAAQPEAVERLALAFRDVISAWFTPEQIAETRRRNAAYFAVGNSCCATHEFCDANEAMAEAMQTTFGSGPFGADGHMADTAISLWNDAWELAQRLYFRDAPTTPTA